MLGRILNDLQHKIESLLIIDKTNNNRFSWLFCRESIAIYLSWIWRALFTLPEAWKYFSWTRLPRLPSVKITVCPTPPMFNLFRDTVTAFNHTFSARGGGGGCNLKLLEIRVLQSLVSSGRVARKMLGMGGRERDIIQNWTIIFGIRQFMMLWSPGE